MKRILNSVALLACFSLWAIWMPMAFAQELTVWVQSDIRRQQFEEIIQWYQTENPNVEINLEMIPASQAEFTERISLAIASGAPPDLTWLEGSTVIELAAQGLLLDVTRALEGLQFTPGDAEEMTFQGKMYGVPYHATSRGLFKRIDLFEESGLDPNVDPASLDELREWSQKLTKVENDGSYSQVGFVPWGANWGAPAWIWTFGGQLLDETKTRPTATHPNNIAAFEWIQSWAETYGHQNPISPMGNTGFVQGTVAMHTDSTTAAGRYVEQGIPFTTGRVPHPPGGQNGTWGGGHALGIPVGSQNVDAAMHLLRYFGLADVQQRRFESSPEALPASWEALQAVVPQLPPAYRALIEQLPEARPRTPLWIDYYVRELRPAESAVVAGTKLPRQALEDVQRVMVQRFAEVFGE